MVVRKSDLVGVRQTSLEAYHDIKDSLGERQSEVLKCLQVLGVGNNRMIAERLGLAINSVTPRVKELRELGLVVEAGRSVCPYSKRRTIFWKVKETDEVKG